MSSSQKVTGLSSGFDTQSIVDQLMKLEKIPYDKLDVKKQTQQLKLQAYQAINSMFLKFKTSVSTLSSQKLWKAKSASSTNEKSLTATANEYAVNGSYAFKVAQLATASQFITKGFASSKTAFVKQQSSDLAYKIGSITLNNSKSRVDTSAKLDTMNGGKGVYRGSVRVTDSSGSTSIIDLSSCDTMDDVVRTLNGSTNAQITASIKDGRLYIEDASGGGGAVKVQNVGNSTTATDLGIAGVGEENGGKALWGRNAYTMGNDTALSSLNDGLGVEGGWFTLRVSNNADYIDVAVDVNDCATVGDVMKRVNNEIQARIQDHAANSNLLEGLRFDLSADKTAFALSGTKAGYTYQIRNTADPTHPDLNQLPATQLGLLGQKTGTGTDALVEFSRVLGGADSPMLKNLSGVNGQGVGTASTTSKLSIPFTQNTLISELNGGNGVDISRALQIKISEGGRDVSDSDDLTRIFEDVLNTTDLNALVSDPTKTIGDLVRFMNKSITDYANDPTKNAAGLNGMKFLVDEYNNRLVIAGVQGGYQVEIGGTLAASLGLTRAKTSSYDTSLRNEGDDADYIATQQAIDDFYGINAANEPLISGNKTIVTEYKAAVPASGDNPGSPEVKKTTLGELDLFHGAVDPTDTLEVANAVAAKLNQGFQFTYAGTDKNGTAFNYTITVNASDLAGIDADTDVTDFVDRVNTVIRDKMAAQNPDVSAPQLRVNTYANGLQWSNMDFTKDFAATGGLAEALGVDKSITAAEVKELPMDALTYDLNPKTSGYFKPMATDVANTSTAQLYMLNGGKSLTFNGADTDTIDFDLGDGKTFSVTLGDLRARLNSNAYGSKSLNTSVEDYAKILNDLVAESMATAGISGVNLKFQVGAGKLEISDLTGADRLKISGAAADAAKTGIGAVSKDAVPTLPFGLANLNAAVFEPQTIDGVGEIKIQLGTEELTLSTDGIDGDSTLQQLIDKLNSQLTGNFVNVKFKVNDAGTGIAIDNNSGKEFKVLNTNDAQTLASDLGLIDKDGNGVKVESYSHYNSTSLGRKYLDRATSLASIMGGPNVPVGTLTITNAGGTTINLDLSDAKTVGDVLDAINSNAAFGVQAMINDTGDGITIVEAYPTWAVPNPLPTGNIVIADFEDGTLAKKLGIAGTATRDNDLFPGSSVFQGSMKTTIDVMSSDTLESLMYRISEKGYKTAVVNDGSSTNPYRLTISSSTTGEASDFVIESDLEMFGFNQTSRGKDSKVLYGDPNSGASPMMLSSSTNSNSNAILGLTLDLKSVSDAWVTISVDTDKQKVVDELKNMVQAYNDMNDLVSYLDAYDPETNQPGVLFGDSSIRKLMEDINDMFYLVFNPDQKNLGSVNDKGVQNTWTWMDLGVSLSAKNSNTDGSGNWYSSMDLDLDALDGMVAKNWDVLYQMLAGQRNASNSTLDKNVKASANFNGKAAEGFKAENAINGDINKGSWGVNNGFMADGTIAQGQNEYTIYFQKPTTMSRMSIYHYDSATALKNFTVEYQDANTGKWETLREIKGNSVDANHLGMALPTTVSAIRIKADSTNAEDGKFRLLDVQVFEDTGLAGQLNQLTTRLGDSQNGFLAERNQDITDSITDIDEQMARLQERMDMKEESLWRRFTAMESALGQLQGQANYFSSMMSSLTNNSSKK